MSRSCAHYKQCRIMCSLQEMSASPTVESPAKPVVASESEIMECLAFALNIFNAARLLVHGAQYDLEETMCLCILAEFLSSIL